MTVAVIGAAAITAVIVTQPEPLTGDEDADAACVAMANGVMEDGEPSLTKLVTMTSEDRRQLAMEISGHAEKSSIKAISDAGKNVAIASTVGTNLLGTAEFVQSLGEFTQACTASGWTAIEAGLYEPPGGK